MSEENTTNTNTAKSVKDPTRSSSNTIIIILLVAILVLGCAAFGFWIKTTSDANSVKWNEGKGEVPDNLSVEWIDDAESGDHITFTTGNNRDNPAIDLYSDPQCPVCRVFEQSNQEPIVKAVKEGHEFRYHPMSFLDSKHFNEHSKNMNEAMIILAKNGDAQAAWKLYSSMWENQSKINSGELPTVEDIASIAKDYDASKDSVNQIKEITSLDNAQKSNDVNAEFLSKMVGQVGTPTLFVAGENVENPFQPENWTPLLNKDISGGKKDDK